MQTTTTPGAKCRAASTREERRGASGGERGRPKAAFCRSLSGATHIVQANPDNEVEKVLAKDVFQTGPLLGPES